VEEFLLRLRCSPLYINMDFGFESMGGNGVLKMSALMLVNVVVSSSMSVDGGKTKLLHVQIFDICPKNFWRPFEFFVTITANGTENFKRP